MLWMRIANSIHLSFILLHTSVNGLVLQILYHKIQIKAPVFDRILHLRRYIFERQHCADTGSGTRRSVTDRHSNPNSIRCPIATEVKIRMMGVGFVSGVNISVVIVVRLFMSFSFCPMRSMFSSFAMHGNNLIACHNLTPNRTAYP